jgi:hypothetical protein
MPRAEGLRRLTVAIEDSDEWRLLDKHATYDLRRDPLEERPLAPHDSATRDDFARQLAIMAEIDAAQRAGAPLLTNQADEQLILKRLQDLGYVE